MVAWLLVGWVSKFFRLVLGCLGVWWVGWVCFLFGDGLAGWVVGGVVGQFDGS